MKKAYFVFLIAIIYFGLQVSGRGEPNLMDYFPAQIGKVYNYGGQGNEYAPFTREVMYVQDNFVQIHDDNSGTRIASVYERQTDRIILRWRYPEFYEDRNIIGDLGQLEEMNMVIIQKPLEVGASWITNNQKREIVGLEESLTITSGTFSDVVIIQVEFLDVDTGIIHEYYARKLGLIKRTFNYQGYEVKSYLESVDV